MYSYASSDRDFQLANYQSLYNLEVTGEQKEKVLMEEMHHSLEEPDSNHIQVPSLQLVLQELLMSDNWLKEPFL